MLVVLWMIIIGICRLVQLELQSRSVEVFLGDIVLISAQWLVQNMNISVYNGMVNAGVEMLIVHNLSIIKGQTRTVANRRETIIIAHVVIRNIGQVGVGQMQFTSKAVKINYVKDDVVFIIKEL
jgi:hypothetical protein